MIGRDSVTWSVMIGRDSVTWSCVSTHNTNIQSFSPFNSTSNEPNLTFAAALAEITYLSVLLILQLVRTAGSVGQFENKYHRNMVLLHQ